MKIDYPKINLETSIVFPLYLCSKELIRKYNNELKKYDLTYTQYLVLMYFYSEKKSNLKKIGKALMLDSSTLTPLLKKLEKKGFITRDKSKLDERNLELKITKKGLSLEENLREILETVKNKINLKENDIAKLHELSYTVLNKIREED